MKYQISRLMFVMVISTLVGVSASSYAADGKAVGDFGWFGVGKAYELEKGHFFWVGEFSGTFFSDHGDGGLFHRAGVKCPGWLDQDFNAGTSKGGGTCIVTDLQGDQAYLSWRNAGKPGPGGRGPGSFQYTGGTGKYADMSGNGRFVGVTQVNWADGTASGYSTWNK